MLPENVEAFTTRFEKEVSDTIAAHLLIPEITIDAEIFFPEINQSFYNIVCQMEPFGPGNMRPVFVAVGAVDTGYSKIVKENHIRFVLKHQEKTFTAIGFNLAHRFHLVESQKPLDIVFTIDQNEWNGETNLQLKIIDLRLSGMAI